MKMRKGKKKESSDDTAEGNSRQQASNGNETPAAVDWQCVGYHRRRPCCAAPKHLKFQWPDADDGSSPMDSESNGFDAVRPGRMNQRVASMYSTFRGVGKVNYQSRSAIFESKGEMEKTDFARRC
jgi:hypothetical protein